MRYLFIDRDGKVHWRDVEKIGPVYHLAEREEVDFLLMTAVSPRAHHRTRMYTREVVSVPVYVEEGQRNELALDSVCRMLGMDKWLG